MSAILNDQSEYPIAIATLLDKVRRLYPYGIPTALIRARSPISETAQAPRFDSSRVDHQRCHFFILRESMEIEKPLHDLLDAICTKGLQVPRDACRVQVLAKDSTSPEQIEEYLAHTNAPLRVVLGGSFAPGTTTETPTGITLFSHPLDLIASELAIKRAFWVQLQGVLSRMAGG